MKDMFNDINQAVEKLYTDSEAALLRYNELKEHFYKHSNAEDCKFFSASGRIEICGNHTDHQGGKVIAAAIEKDAVALAAKNDSGIINIFSKGQKPFSVDVKITQPQKNEYGKSSGMVRGIAAYFIKNGGNAGGMDMCINSNVATGSGISSSAAFETVVATAINHFYNDGAFSPIQIAKAGQYAESKYFGKPCGLMDQAASAIGGALLIDFANDEPKTQAVNMQCITDKYDIFLINTGSSHAKLGKEYASIVKEMVAVAGFFGKNVLSEVDEAEFMANIKNVRRQTSDRAVLRAMHYFEETKRVERAALCLKNDDVSGFLKLINESGTSSELLLQNVYLDHVHDKSVALALAMTKRFFAEQGCKGACRIHGGGFLGTILAFIPKESSKAYKLYMESVFGENSAYPVRIRSYGGIMITKL